ncbi:MAG: hypothetical protein R3B09_11060 [Nannocystaceae bacterium]
MQAGNIAAAGAVHVDLATIHAQARVVVSLTGADARRFLQGLLSADVEALGPGEAQAATLLTVKGKIITEVIVLHGDDGGLGLAIPADVADATLADLDRHIIMDDVALSVADGVVCALVWPEVPVQGPVSCYRARHPLPGLLVVGPRGAVVDEAGRDPSGLGGRVHTPAPG